MTLTVAKTPKLFDFLDMPYEMQTITLSDGVSLPVTVIGSGRPVLMLHAFGMDARQFLPFILSLCGDYQFYLPHLRGFGLANQLITPQFDFIEQYASDTQEIICHITALHNVKSLPVAAISMGALVIWAYFAKFGDSRVSRYLNIDQSPIVHNRPDWLGGVFSERQSVMFDKFQSVVDATMPYRHLDNFSHLPYTVKRHVLEVESEFSLLSVSRWQTRQLAKLSAYQPTYKLPLYQHATWQQKMRGLEAYLALPYDYRDSLAQVTIPVTLLIGGRSQLYAPQWQLKLADMLADATVVILEKSGHAVPLDAPIAFFRVLKNFLYDN